LTKRQKRLLIIIGVLVLLLALLAGYYYYYRNTKLLTFSSAPSVANAVTPPQFLFSFSGTGLNRLQRPVGVLVDKGKVYVADSQRHTIFTFDENGKRTGSFGASETVNPLYIAKNPKDGLLYITDRRLRQVLKFTTDGKYMGVFDPKLPKGELPKFKLPKGVQWVPLTLTFGKDGTLYVVDLLNGHRLLIFGPDGTFKKSVGTAAIVLVPDESPTAFQFPNGLMIVGNELYVADSNNQRIQVFDLNGEFKRFIVTRGLPRGIAELGKLPGDDVKAPKRFLEVDTLAHDVTIWTAKGDKVLNFGEQGVLDGQFSYPTDVTVGARNRIFVTDTSNARVQVWGWPAQITGVPVIPTNNLAWCLLPLLLLPFLLLARKKKFFATADFVETMIVREEAETLTAGRWKWITSETEYEKILALQPDDSEIDLETMFEPVEYSESDVAALVEKYEIDHEFAVSLAVAGRAKLTATEDDELRRLAKVLEYDVVNALEFVDRFKRKTNK